MAKTTTPKTQTAKKTAVGARKRSMTFEQAVKRADHPDIRLPIDDDSELLCKRSSKDNQYRCREVSIGGDW